MKRFTLILSMLVLMGIGMTVQAQLADGTIAPDFTVTDIDGNTHHLYEYLDEGKTVVIDFSATWCAPCWSYAQAGTLDDLYEERGPDGTNDVMVLFIEGDASTTDADLNGTGGNTQGDWVSLVQYPIVDGLDGSNLATTYSIAYWPTLYTIAPNRLVSESQQVGIAEYEAVIEANAAFVASGVNNAAFLGYSGGAATCPPFTPAFQIQNLGSGNMTSCDIEVTTNGVTSVINWTGNASSYEFFEVELDPVTTAGTADYTLEITNVNGMSDDDNSNNAYQHIVSIPQAGNGGNDIQFSITPDAYPEEITISLIDPNGATVESFNDFVAGQSFSLDIGSYEFTESGCHKLLVADSYGDGVSLGGSIELAVDGAPVYTDDSYGFEVELSFVVNVGDAPVAPTAIIEGAELNTASYTASAISDDPAATYSWMVDGMTVEGTDLDYTFTANGTYDVVLTVTGANGLTTTTTTQVEVTMIPPSASIGSGAESDGGIYVANASSDGAGDTFAWVITDANGNVVDMVEGAEFMYDFEFNGAYTLTLTVTGPAGATTTEVRDVDIATATNVGIEELANINAVKLYPVPTTNVLNLELTLNDSQTMKVTVSNILGQTVATVNQEDFAQGTNFVQVNTVDFSNGLYFINVETATQVATQRFVISK